MPFLYILAESDNDVWFYNACVEKILEKTCQIEYRRLQKRSGIREVRINAKRLLREIKGCGKMENIFFIIALDNDRSPVHPSHERLEGLSRKESSRECRFCEINSLIEEFLGKDRDKWPIQGAIAVPVQMIESWLLLICNSEKYKNEASLPLFAKKDSYRAIEYYKPNQPSEQLKDLCEKEQKNLEITSPAEFFLHCGINLNLLDLQEQSPSFALFKSQVDAWTIH